MKSQKITKQLHGKWIEQEIPAVWRVLLEAGNYRACHRPLAMEVIRALRQDGGLTVFGFQAPISVSRGISGGSIALTRDRIIVNEEDGAEFATDSDGDVGLVVWAGNRAVLIKFPITQPLKVYTLVAPESFREPYRSLTEGELLAAATAAGAQIDVAAQLVKGASPTEVGLLTWAANNSDLWYALLTEAGWEGVITDRPLPEFGGRTRHEAIEKDGMIGDRTGKGEVWEVTLPLHQFRGAMAALVIDASFEKPPTSGQILNAWNRVGSLSLQRSDFFTPKKAQQPDTGCKIVLKGLGLLDRLRALGLIVVKETDSGGANVWLVSPSGDPAAFTSGKRGGTDSALQYLVHIPPIFVDGNLVVPIKHGDPIPAWATEILSAPALKRDVQTISVSRWFTGAEALGLFLDAEVDASVISPQAENLEILSLQIFRSRAPLSRQDAEALARAVHSSRSYWPLTKRGFLADSMRVKRSNALRGILAVFGKIGKNLPVTLVDGKPKVAPAHREFAVNTYGIFYGNRRGEEAVALLKTARRAAFVKWGIKICPFTKSTTEVRWFCTAAEDGITPFFGPAGCNPARSAKMLGPLTGSLKKATFTCLVLAGGPTQAFLTPSGQEKARYSKNDVIPFLARTWSTEGEAREFVREAIRRSLIRELSNEAIEALVDDQIKEVVYESWSGELLKVFTVARSATDRSGKWVHAGGMKFCFDTARFAVTSGVDLILPYEEFERTQNLSLLREATPTTLRVGNQEIHGLVVKLELSRSGAASENIPARHRKSTIKGVEIGPIIRVLEEAQIPFSRKMEMSEESEELLALLREVEKKLQ